MIIAVRYLVCSGCGWRILPIIFGRWRTVYGRFRELARRFLLTTPYELALILDSELAGREGSPPAAVIDGQTVKAPPGKTRCYDCG